MGSGSRDSRKKSRWQRKWGGAPTWGWALIAVGFTVAITVVVTAASEPKVVKPADDPLRLPRAGEQITFLGDSWTKGYHAQPATRGFAYVTAERFNAKLAINGEGGSGYANPAPGNTGTYLTRLNRLKPDPLTRLLVLQGGINDMRFFSDFGAYTRSVVKTIQLARTKFPEAEIVVLGPAPGHLNDVNPLTRVTRAINSAAIEANVFYVPSVLLNWIRASNITELIDPVTRHPNTRGHAQLADDFVSALTRLSTGGQSSLWAA